ncbi:retrovirus-related pol polyprotein from transposon TNT 1-94 [Tanacetum coccineum]
MYDVTPFPKLKGLPKIDESHSLSKPVTLNSIPTPQESKVVKNKKVIALGMFRINPYKTSREDKFMSINKVRASVRTNPISVSQLHVIIKKDVNSNSNGLSSTGIESTAKTRRSQPMSNTKNDRVSSVSKSSCIKNKEVEVKKPKKVGSTERLASPKPRKPRSFLRWLPTRRNFNLKGKIIAFSESESQSDCSKGHSNLFMVRRLGMLKAHDMKSEASHKFHLEVLGNWHNMFSVGQFCDSYLEQEKSKKAFHPPKPVPNSKQRSKDEAPEEIKTFLKKITVILQAPVIIVRTDNGTEFKNQVLKEYFDSVGISHQASSVKPPQQNRVVEQRNRTLVEAARTMLIFSCAPLFLWAKAIATACYTQNRSIIH